MRIRIYFDDFSNAYYAIYDNDSDDDDRCPYGTGVTPLDAELDLIKNYPCNPTIEERLNTDGD